MDCRRAVRRGAEKIELRLVASPDEIAPALERLFVMHAERWRTRGGEIPRFSTTEAHRDWYRRVVAAMAERGDVLISELREDGELVASSLAFVAGRGAAAHTTAVRVGGKLKEPGRAPQLHLCRALEDIGVEAVDLGPGACEPGSPKAGLGPTRHVVPRLLAAGSRRSQRAVNTALAVRARVRGSRR
jgi:CelD/BcsL family acetyltransferase involved in cellulose biosynthesis